MNCKTTTQLISRSLDGELSGSEQAALREHLAQCAPCRELEQGQRRLNLAMQNAASPVLPPDYFRRLQEAVQRKIAHPAPRRIFSFRTVAVAAVLVLGLTAAFLGWRLYSLQQQAEPVAENHSPARGGARGTVPLPSDIFARNVTAEGSNEQVQSFLSVQDYLGGALRWMAIDGNQVEIGMSGNSSVKAAASQGNEELIVVELQYIERKGNAKVELLSNPQFILMPGEEASVRLAHRDKSNTDMFRYRVKAVRQDGVIRAHVEFARESVAPQAAGHGVDAAISADAQTTQGKAVLLGAAGDAECRRELYMSTATRPARPINHSSTREGKLL